MFLESSSLKPRGHFSFSFFSTFFHLPPSCHQPYYLTSLFPNSAWILPKLNLITRCSINGSFPDVVVIIFRLLISLHLSFIIFVISLKLQSCYFLLININPIFYSSSFISLAQLLTRLSMFLPFITWLLRIFCIPHIIRY